MVLSKNYQDFLSGHVRMDGHSGINQVQRIIVGRVHTFILFAPSYGDLHSYVRTKRKLLESEAMPLFKQVVQIVADCHSNGIILRDLKLRKFIFSNKERYVAFLFDAFRSNTTAVNGFDNLVCSKSINRLLH